MQAAIVGGDVTQAKAQEAFKAYRQLIREGRGTADDKLLMKSYRAIAKGKRLLDLRETLRAAGLDEKHQPRLAIARADQEQVVFVVAATRCLYTAEGVRLTRASFADGVTIGVNRGVYPALDGQNWFPAAPGRAQYTSSLRAAVPPIPAQFRPADSLAGYHILWEAEWTPVAPKDPILLKRIGAHLFAVVAQWDLTELERSVLGARLS
jgi:hypothetical protein